MKLSKKVHVTKQGVIKRNPKTAYRIIAMKVFDWREDRQASEWISLQKSKKRDVYQLDEGTDAIVLVVVKKGLGLQTVKHILQEDLSSWSSMYEDGDALPNIEKR